jgi:glycosyltransferase involved in cell wall biosynthesis
MKILFLNHNQEGLGTYWRCLFFGKHLSKRGHQIKMICASGKRFDLLIRKKKINKNFILITLPRICYHTYFTGQVIFRLPLTCFLVLVLDYDLLYAFTVAQVQIALPALLGKFLRRKRLIIDWDDLWGGGFAKVHGGLVELVLTFFERKTLRFADKITYVSELIGGEIKKLGLLNRAEKFPNGANIDQIKPVEKNKAKEKLSLKKGEKYIISVGNTYTESLGLFIRAFNLACQKVKNLTLLLVGSAQVPKNLLPLLKKRGVITGPKPYSEIPYWLGAADVLALPMEDNPIERARFPIRLGDYLCAQRPIVSNAVGEVKSYLEKHNCGLVSKSNEKDLASAIIKLYDNPSLGEELAKRARGLAEGELSWQKIVQDLEKWIIKD